MKTFRTIFGFLKQSGGIIFFFMTVKLTLQGVNPNSISHCVYLHTRFDIKA